MHEYLDTHLSEFDVKLKKFSKVVIFQKKIYKLVWVESICDEPETIEKNIRKAKVNNPDYVGEEPERVVKILKLLKI